MAGHTGKKPRKSGKPKGDGSGKPGKKHAASKKEPPKKPPIPKKADIQCQFCGKPMKDGKTKKLHERNCMPKSSAPPAQKNGLESEILDLRNRFDDEKESILKTFQDKEDHLQRELEEIKTVLRMEMDRHRKELERLSKVESDMSTKQDVQASPPNPPEDVPPPREATRPQPKAIDLIPMRVPHIPRMRVPQHTEDENSIPDLDEDMDLPPMKNEPGLGKEAIEELVRETVRQSMPEPRAAEDNVGGKVNLLSGRLDHLDSKIERNISEMKKQLERISKDAEMKKIEKDLEKISERVQDMMEDSGYGESLSVSKIPPTILEIVYQAILDDIHIEIIRTKGAQDADKIARSALEEVRLKTSGSELFKFDGRKIVTDSLAKSIESNMISAKQIQTTYDVLMEKLLETVPHHKAKNFKGMIKVKSQEFAVDRATKLTKENARLEKILESTNQMIAAMSANFNAHNVEIRETLKNMQENTLASKANAEDLDALKFKLEESNERTIKLADELALLKAQMEMNAGIIERAERTDEPSLTPGEESSFIPPMLPVEVPAEHDESAEQCDAIFGAISRGLDSKTAIIKETGLDGETVRQRLSEMVASKRIIEKKAGKRAVYTTLELELGKLKEEELPAREKRPGRKRDAPEEPDAQMAIEPTIPETKPGTITLDDSKPEEIVAAPEPDIEEPAIEEEQISPESKPGTITLDDSQPDEAPEPGPATEEQILSPESTEEIKEEPKVQKRQGKKKAKKPEPEKSKSEPKPSKKKAKKPEAPSPEPAPEAVPDKPEISIGEEFPVMAKPLEELSEDEAKVLDAISEDGVTISGIQSKVGKQLKRVDLLRALRVLIDSGLVNIIAKGRMEMYQRINVQKIDKTDNRKNKQEVK